MVKYLIKKNHVFWYRRKINGFGEIVLSLKTKNFDKAIIRHSYIDFKVKQIIYKGALEIMTADEIKELISKYKNYMISEEYNDFEEMRDKELEITINGQKYGGHTKQALEYAINRYHCIHQKDDIDLIKQETTKILKRSNITTNDISKLTTKKEQKIFHWELFKAEWDLLHHAYEEQKRIAKEVVAQNHNYNQIIRNNSLGTIQAKNNITISQIVNMYINENKGAKNWSDKNSRDLNYVLGHLSGYTNDKLIDELTREHFSNFRDNVLRYLPKTSQNKIFIGKNTHEIIDIVKKHKIECIGLTTINKHLRRIHQVFEWALNCDYLIKNLTKDLQLIDKNKSKKQKTAKLPYSKEELIKLFNESPWFNNDLISTLKCHPENVFIPLLALFTGAKPLELGTLKISAITKKNNIWGIDFNQMIKNSHTERFTPLSQIIIELGFLKYVSHQKKTKATLLFPNVKIYKGGGINFTNYFTVYNRKFITSNKDKTFYSLRHLVNQQLKNKKTPIYIINDILGHSDGNGNKDNEIYGDKLMPEDALKDTIDKCLVYDFLDFSKLKKAINQIYT